MDVGHAVLFIFLLLSVIVNGLQWYRWHSYRSKPAGVHSHTGMMQAVRVKQPPRER